MEYDLGSIHQEILIPCSSQKTIMLLLKDMYLGYFLHPYRARINRQTIQETPKFYLFDTGIANYLKRYQFREM